MCLKPLRGLEGALVTFYKLRKPDDRMRKFETVKRITEPESITLPRRGTKGSAGYDFFATEDVEIRPGCFHTFATGVKASMEEDDFLQMHIRSSLGFKKCLMLANTTGIIDSDYYSNPDNDGEIHIKLFNYGSNIVEIKKGDAVAQGIFVKYYKTDNDLTESTRQGGIGSTGR